MTKATLRSLLAGRLASVEARIRSACARVGRDRSEVTLVAVTKSASIEAACLLKDLGAADLGESRPQELWRKAEHIHDGVRWHLIGHLQRNKVERTLPLVKCIHSVDSIRLLGTIEQEAARSGARVEVLLEVNASREANKHGFAPEALEEGLGHLGNLLQVQVAGLMTMAALEDDPDACRSTFAMLRELRDHLRCRVQSPHRLDELSMGMTNDFEVAIEEGATLVRIGSALFADLEDMP